MKPRFRDDLFTCLVTVAGDAVIIFALVEILTTTLAVWSVSISRAVEAVTAMAGGVVESLIKVTTTGESVTIAS